MLFNIFRRARGYLGPSDYGRVGVIEADSADEADRLWWQRHPDPDGLVVGQWAEASPPGFSRSDIRGRTGHRSGR